jgi:hypothetical protein
MPTTPKILIDLLDKANEVAKFMVELESVKDYKIGLPPSSGVYVNINLGITNLGHLGVTKLNNYCKQEKLDYCIFTEVGNNYLNIELSYQDKD